MVRSSQIKQQPYWSSSFVFECNKRARFMSKSVMDRLWVWKWWYWCVTLFLDWVFCLTSDWPSDIKRDGMFVICMKYVYVFFSCVTWLEIIWFELLWIVTILSLRTFKLTSLSTLLTLPRHKSMWILYFFKE